MKRRRTDNSGPSTSQIAESNNTLRFLSGRHNRWMSGGGGGDANGQAQTGNAAANLSAVRSNAASTSHAEVAEVRASTATNTVPSTNGINIEARPPERPPSTSTTTPTPIPRTVPSSGPALVQYESPNTAANGIGQIGLPTPAGNGRKSVDAMTRHTGQPSLPSPASSDDSPTFAAQALQRGRTSTSQSRNSIGAANGVSARPMVNSPHAAHQPSPLQQPVPRQAPIPGHPPPTPPIHQQMAYGQAMPPQQYHTQPQPHYRHSIASNVPPQPPRSYGQNQHVRTPSIVPSNAPAPSPRQLLPSRIPPATLLTQLAGKETELRQAGQLSPTDSGRIALLREAVQKGDWFYQVLSQVFCLRTVSERLLPQSLRDVNENSWEFINTLICSNNMLNRGLVEFFADFPEPIMDIYSTNGRDIYEGRLLSVKECLVRLPLHWDQFVHRCKCMNAPPLVQDLSHILHLKTPILQSTAFRAIARMLYGSSELDSKGVQAVERLHQIDQDAYLVRRHRRTPEEMQQAYQVMSAVFHSWQQHLARYSPNVPDFAVPQNAVHYFQQPPPSSMPVVPQQNASHRSSVQHQQAIQQQQMSNAQLLNPLIQAHAQAQNGRSSPISHHVGQNQMPPQLAQLASLGMQLQAGRPAVQTPTISATPTTPRPQRLIFPRVQDQPRPQPTNPDWMRSGIHQAHLRTPELGAREYVRGSPRLYRHVIGFNVPPTKLNKSLPVQKVTFSMSQKSMDRIAKTDAPRNKCDPPYRHVAEGSLMYRLRCSVLPRAGFASESAWVTADNIWPDDMYFELNGTKLETRRKLHHGRYRPIDLTSLLRLGENQLKVCRARAKADYRVSECALAIEVVGVMSHESIREKIARISAADSLAAIKKSLTGYDSGDDELAFTSSSVTIKLFDPYSACKIFDIPARGSNCLHRDCFDLETFLQMCTRPHPGWPTVVDCWRCPLCLGDVRPQTLVIDDFLVDVRKELDKQGRLDTRAIIVDADGSWRPKPEETTGVRSASLDREERGSMSRPTSTVPTAPPPKPREVIVLD